MLHTSNTTRHSTQGAHGRSIKSLCLAPHVVAKKATYAVVCQVMKCEKRVLLLPGCCRCLPATYACLVASASPAQVLAFSSLAAALACLVAPSSLHRLVTVFSSLSSPTHTHTP